MRLIKLVLPVIVLFSLHEKIIAQDTTKVVKDTTNLMSQLEKEQEKIKRCILLPHLSTPALSMAIR